MQSAYWLEKALKMIFLYVNALLCTLQRAARNDTAELHRVYDNMLQRAQKCSDVQEDHFQHLLKPVSTLHLHLFNFLYRVRDLRPRSSTRRRAGFSCATDVLGPHHTKFRSPHDLVPGICTPLFSLLSGSQWLSEGPPFFFQNWALILLQFTGQLSSVLFWKHTSI